MGHRREELALDAIGLPERRGLHRLAHELLSLGPEVLELAQKARHQVRGEDEDAHVEGEAPRLRHKAERFGAICGDRDVRERDGAGRGEGARRPETKTARDDDETADHPRGPAWIRRKDEHRRRNDADVEDKHHACKPLETLGLRLHHPVDDRGVPKHEDAKTDQIRDPDVREKRTQEEDQTRAPDARPVECPLQPLSHGR